MTREPPMDPEVLAELEAIDAARAGEPVAEEFAELAELTWVLQAGRPEIDPAFADALDRRAAERFRPRRAPAPRARRSPRSRRRRLLWGSGAGALATAAAVALVVVVLSSGSGGSETSHPATFDAAAPHATATTAAPSAHGGVAAGSSASAAATTPSASAPAATSSATAGTSSSGSTNLSAKALPGAQMNIFGPGRSSSVPAPDTSGRKTEQSARLQLNTDPGKVDAVAQEAFDVIGDENGIVSSSHVSTGSGGGDAEISLTVPAGNLQDTITRLSRLSDAVVGERDDATQDVTDTYNVDVRTLGDARARRSSLLKQLAAATTTEETDSLDARIKDNAAAITRDEKSLDALNRKVGRAPIQLTIEAVPGVLSGTQHHHSGSGGFTLGRALHDAGRVLVVAIGVLVIAAAVLVPVALLAAIGVWLTLGTRRRRREAALDG